MAAEPVDVINLDTSLFYQKQAIHQLQMTRLTEEREKLLRQIRDLNEESNKLHPVSACGCVKVYREGIEKYLAETDGVAIPPCIFDGNGFTLDKLYKNWNTAIKRIVKQQEEVIKDVTNQWFGVLEEIALEDNSYKLGWGDFGLVKGAEGKDTEETSDKDAAQENNCLNFKWYVFLVVFSVLNSFLFFTNEDVEQCVNHPIDCVGNILFKFNLKLFEHYASFRNMSINFNSTEN